VLVLECLVQEDRGAGSRCQPGLASTALDLETRFQIEHEDEHKHEDDLIAARPLCAIS